MNYLSLDCFLIGSQGKNATVELDVDGNKQVGETHDTQQSKRINKTRKNESSAWEFYIKVSENGKTSYAICPVCNIKLGAKIRNGTTTLLRHGCFKEWKKNLKQQSVSNVKSSAKANPKNKASQKIAAGAPPQAKRRKLVAKVGEEREEEETSSACMLRYL
jgi:hypothetical protein